jgi:hypothetical protein
MPNLTKESEVPDQTTDVTFLFLQPMWLQKLSKYLTTEKILVQYNQEQKKKLALIILHFCLVQGKLYYQGQNQVLKHYLEDSKIPTMLRKCMKESVVGISHPKSQFTRSWMQSINGQQCTRMFI